MAIETTHFQTATPTSGDTVVLVFLVVAALIAIILFSTSKQTRRRRSIAGQTSYRPNAWRPVVLDNSRPSPPPSMADPRDQMIAISTIGFETVPLLNREEARLLPVLEKAVRAHGNGHRVMAQTCLGELIRPKEEKVATGSRSAAYASINSKRLDFAIINRFGHLVLAIEYQGTGHHQGGKTFMRDAVKREAIRKAGVPLLEVSPDFMAEEIARQIRGILLPASSQPEREPPRAPS